jgi:uncharacterized protein
MVGETTQRRHIPQFLADIYDAIDRRVDAITAAQPLWPCQKGCDGCCRQLAQIPAMTAAEWRVLHQGFAQLAPATQAHVARHIRALDPASSAPVTCPFLDDANGACRIYAHRPAACRTYGFYVSRQGNLWCDMIQARDADGMSAGLILGNHDAVARQLEEDGGEIKSLVTWFEQSGYPT